MKRLFLVTVLAMVMGFSTLVQADPFPGTQNLYDRGGGLIYNADLDITWYDYSYAGPIGQGTSWGDAKTWASGLTVGGTTLGSWQLPTELNQSEMGHLYYTELGNIGWPNSDWGLKKNGPFFNLEPTFYWAREEYSSNLAYGVHLPIRLPISFI